MTLGPKHIQVRDFILRYQAEHGERPQLKIIADECGISISTAGAILTALKDSRELIGPVFKAAGA